MKKLTCIVAALAIAVCSNSQAMRCGNSIIDMGDSMSTVLQACGTPSVSYGQSIVYTNPNSDGMNYTIHFSNDNTVDNITNNRG